MKKLIIILSLVLAQQVSAQSLFWTNSTPVYTNLTYGLLTVPMSQDAYLGCQYWADKHNADFNLVVPNKLKDRDFIAFAAWQVGYEWKTQRDNMMAAKANVRSIREALAGATDQQLTNILAILGLPWQQ